LRAAGRLLYTSCYGGVSVWSVEEGRLVQSYAFKGSLVSLALSPDAKVVACGSQDGTVHFWRTASGSDAEMSGYPSKPRALAWDPFASLLATGGAPAVTVWDCGGRGPEGTRPIVLEGHLVFVSTLAFTPARALLASGADDGTILLWYPRKQPKPLGFAFLDERATALAYHPEKPRAAYVRRKTSLASAQIQTPRSLREATCAMGEPTPRRSAPASSAAEHSCSDRYEGQVIGEHLPTLAFDVHAGIRHKRLADSQVRLRAAHRRGRERAAGKSGGPTARRSDPTSRGSHPPTRRSSRARGSRGPKPRAGRARRAAGSGCVMPGANVRVSTPMVPELATPGGIQRDVDHTERATMMGRVLFALLMLLGWACADPNASATGRIVLVRRA
jgi:hypothetical protein